MSKLGRNVNDKTVQFPDWSARPRELEVEVLPVAGKAGAEAAGEAVCGADGGYLWAVGGDVPAMLCGEGDGPGGSERGRGWLNFAFDYCNQ